MSNYVQFGHQIWNTGELIETIINVVDSRLRDRMDEMSMTRSNTLKILNAVKNGIGFYDGNS